MLLIARKRELNFGGIYTPIDVAKKLLTFPEAKEDDVKHELYSCLADNYFGAGDIKTAVSYLELIIAESKDQDLIDYTKETKELFLQQQ